MQFDQGHKGFSFSKEGPLDMRMDPSTPVTAKEIVNHWSEKELGEIFREYGEEPKWRRAAEAICSERKKQSIDTTNQLADILISALGFRGKKKLHPATLIFQALRICVNNELGSIQTALDKAIKFLSPGGKIGVLSFHSLEDRIVKNIFREAAKPPGKRERVPVPPLLRLLTKKPLEPSFEEKRANPRSRSAKLRFAEKLGLIG
jgi:16S rRNA (cytosine1402-N4)-methyltransferase